MNSVLDKDHYINNLLARIDTLERKVSDLERFVIYQASFPTKDEITGMVAVVHAEFDHWISREKAG